MRCLTCGYSLLGLTIERCPECGQSFSANDPRTWACDPPRSRRGLVVAASFTGTFFGWALAFGLHAVRQSAYSPYVGDLWTWFYRTLATVGLWWALLMVPCLLITRVPWYLRRFFLAVAIGAVHGCAGAWLILGWGPLQGAPIDAVVYVSAWAGLVGAVAAGFVSLILRPKWVRSGVPTPRRLFAVLWCAPPVSILIWFFAAWPALCRIAPDWAFRVGTEDTREWVIRYVLDPLKVGDPASRLSDRLPYLFDPAAATAIWGASSSRYGRAAQFSQCTWETDDGIAHSTISWRGRFNHLTYFVALNDDKISWVSFSDVSQPFAPNPVSPWPPVGLLPPGASTDD